jgi:hypothetical protein
MVPRKPPCSPPCALGALSIVGMFLAHDFARWWSRLLPTMVVGSVTSANHARMAVEYIAVHPNASIAEDVISIEHTPDFAKISVTLKPNARCRRPFLRGRLSGPALVVVKDWRYHSSEIFDTDNHDREAGKTTNNDNTTKFFVEATYPTPPVAGTYFLELIVVFCKNMLIFPPPMLPTAEQEREMVWNNSYNFARTCTEDAVHRQLTSTNATITVLATIKSEGGSPPGFWIHKHHTMMKPLFTRYQLATCYRKDTPECLPPITSVEPFREYYFQFGEQTTSAPTSSGAVESSSNIIICIVGSSHARNMAQSLTEAINATQIMNVAIQYHDFRMPFQVTTNAVRSMISGNGCQRLIISVGQWPAGKRFRVNADGPWTIARFHGEYRQMARRLYDAFPTLPTIYRSINYNPLGGLIGACPPTDWRSPALIDGYNAAIGHVIEELHNGTAINNSSGGGGKGSANVVQFVDTNFLVGPMWDAASDWCHLDPPLALLQGVYIVQKALLMGTQE